MPFMAGGVSNLQRTNQVTHRSGDSRPILSDCAPIGDLIICIFLILIILETFKFHPEFDSQDHTIHSRYNGTTRYLLS
jgi:hypothetical protein